jgi:YD repeat-containing protein
MAITYPNGTELHYEYDKKNQLTEIIDGDTITTYRYDGVGQVQEIVYGDATKSSYTYLPTGEISESVTYQANGKVASKQVYAYDENGNIIKEELTYPKFKLTKTYAYDDEDQLIQVTEKEKNTTRVTTYFYDNVGNRIASELTVNGKSKGYTEWQQNADNELLSITGEQGATYTYDANGTSARKHVSQGKLLLISMMPRVV